MEKKISVIIPCYNVEEYIDRCVESLVHQTIGVDILELIFVDDASEDGTLAKLEQWERIYPESVLIVACDQNHRQGAARNIGTEYASCPWLIYIDADDWIEPDMLEAMYQAAVRYDVEVTGCHMGRDMGDGQFFSVEPIQGQMGEPVRIQSKQDRHELLKLNFGPAVGKLYKKLFLERNKIFFPEELAYEDNFFQKLVIYHVQSYLFLESVYYHYYYNPQSTVTQKNAIHQFDRLEIALATRKELVQRGFEQSFSKEIEQDFIRKYYLNTLHILFTRFDRQPYDVLERMQNTVLELYPECLSDIAFQEMQPFEQSIMVTLQRKLLPAEWEEIAQAYQEFCVDRASRSKEEC